MGEVYLLESKGSEHSQSKDYQSIESDRQDKSKSHRQRLAKV